MKQFKEGDKVTYTYTGLIDWEDIDEAVQDGLEIGKDYTVLEVHFDGTALRIEEGLNQLWIHPDHFTLKITEGGKFPNGFDSWHETHYEISAAIGVHLHKWEVRSEGSAIIERYESQGTGGMYELAEEWTNEFEFLHPVNDWVEVGLDFFDEIEKFLITKNKLT